MKLLKPSYKGITPKTLTSYIATIYLIVMFVIYPFYMKEGYVNIGEHKFKFFLYSSIGAVLLLLFTGLVELIKNINNATITDGFIFLFIITTVISYFLSPYKEIAFLGSDGWFLGLVFLLIISTVYFLLKRLWEYEAFIIYLSIGISSIIYLIGLLDRFSLYLIPLSVRNPSFISTLGNINWFMGYYSIFTPIGIILFLLSLHNKDIHKPICTKLLGAYTFIAFITGFSQGSESVFLVFFAIFNICVYLAYKKYISLDSLLVLGLIWSISAQFVRFLRLLMPNMYNYDTDGMCAYLTGNNITIYIGICILSIYIFINRCALTNSSKLNKYILLVPILEIIGALFIITIGIIKTNTNILSGFNNSLFYFDIRFGSGRGCAYKATIMTLRQFNLKELIIGIGPDCYAQRVYSIPEIKNMLINIWPNDTLTNAHNELLTMLVNEGILGVVAYFGIFISFIIRGLKRSASPIFICIAGCVFSYLIHNLISFTQVLSTPYIFILMAIADAYESKNNS